MYTISREHLIDYTRNLLNFNPLFFDTETTGVGDKDQVLTIDVLDIDENVECSRMYKPTVPIDPKAIAVHGITEALAAKGLDFNVDFYQVKSLFDGRAVVAYNAFYDIRILNQTMAATGKSYPSLTPMICCDAMILYSRFANVVGPKLDPKWFKLTEACSRENVEMGDLKAHNSIDDVIAMIRLMKRIAGAE